MPVRFRTSAGTARGGDVALKIHKVVASLPSTLEPDAIYAVRAGTGFDLYIADSTGSVAHKVNADGGGASAVATGATFVGPILSTYWYDTAYSGGSTASVAGTANRVDLLPLIPPRTLVIDAVGVRVTTTVAGALARGLIYASSSDGAPDALLADVQVDCSGGNSFGSLPSPLTLQAGQLYYTGVWHSSTATVSALGNGQQRALGGSSSLYSNAMHSYLRRSIPFSDPAPNPWGFVPSDLGGNASIPTLRLRVV